MCRQGFGANYENKSLLFLPSFTLISGSYRKMMAKIPLDQGSKSATKNNTLIDRDPFVQSFARGLSIIKCFDAENPAMTLSQIAERVNLSRAAARRFLLTLENLGYVSLEGRNFQLTAKVLDLGYGYLSSLSLPEIAQPHLETLASRVHESASASVLDGTDIIYVARVPIRRIMSVKINIGTRMPAHATSMGRVLLAGLSSPELKALISNFDLPKYTKNTITSKSVLLQEINKVRIQGWSINDQELEYGLRSIAVPILNKAQKVVASINISTTAQSNTLESMEAMFLPELRITAKKISDDLASARPFS
jgi:IclR family pca regulon transcriptional regulator